MYMIQTHAKGYESLLYFVSHLFYFASICFCFSSTNKDFLSLINNDCSIVGCVF
jgi:hypothetical protein